MKIKITNSNVAEIVYPLSTPLTSGGIPTQTMVVMIAKIDNCFYPYTDIGLSYIGDYETEVECTKYISKFIYRKLSPILNYLKHIEGGNKSVLENAEITKILDRDQIIQKDIIKDLTFTRDNKLIVRENSGNQSMSEQSPISDVIGTIDTPNFKSHIAHTKDVENNVDDTEKDTGTIADDTIITDDYTDTTTNFNTEYQIKARRYLLSDDVNRIFESIVKSTIQEFNNIY